MKKVMTTIGFLGLFNAALNAQEASKATQKPEMSKEEKAKQRQKEDSIRLANYRESGLNEDEIKQMKEVTAEARKKSEEVNNDASLSAEQKKEKMKAIGKERDDKHSEIMGKERRKLYAEIKRKKKEAEEANKQ